MNKPIVIGATILALLAASTFIPMAAAQYVKVGGGGQTTIEEQKALAEAKVKIVAANPAQGSGTPYLDANGVIGGSVVVAAVFGGIAIVFVLKGRSGRFAKAK